MQEQVNGGLADLLQWVNSAVGGRSDSRAAWARSFNDGRLLSALVQYYLPMELRGVPYREGEARETTAQRLSEVFDAAERCVGVPTIIDSHEMAAGLVHPRVVSTYVALLRNAFADEERREERNERKSYDGKAAFGKVRLRKVPSKEQRSLKAESPSAEGELRRLMACERTPANLVAIRKAINTAKKAGASPETISSAKAALHTAETLEVLHKKLQRIVQIPELQLDFPGTVRLWGDALQAGVKKETILSVHDTLRGTAKIQARQNAVARCLQAWVDTDPLRIDLSLMAKAIARATESQLSEDKVCQAEAILGSAQEAQELRDNATVGLLLAAAPTPDKLDMKLLGNAIECGRLARVEPSLLQEAMSHHEGLGSGRIGKSKARLKLSKAMLTTTSKEARQEKAKHKRDHRLMMLTVAETARVEQQLSRLAADASESKQAIGMLRSSIDRAGKQVRDSITAALQARDQLHAISERAKRGEQSRDAGLEVVASKVIYEVSYDSPLIEIDVGAFEQELAELADVDASGIFVELQARGSPSAPQSITTALDGGSGCLGCGSKPSPATADPINELESSTCTVALRATLFIPSFSEDIVNQVKTSLTSAEHPLIKAAAKPPSLNIATASHIVMRAYMDSRPEYVEARKLYDISFTKNAQVFYCRATLDVSSMAAVVAFIVQRNET
jgi:hypothetical protein